MHETLKEISTEKAEDLAGELEILLIDQSISLYEKAKDMVLKDIHNNCEFEYICNLMMLLFELKIDEYLDNKDFYKEFISDHMIWAQKTMQHFSKLFSSKDDERKKWSGLTMIDLSKMESLEKHLKTIKEWNRYMGFQRSVSTRGKNLPVETTKGKKTKSSASKLKN
jgi:hypothetical protein